jgi:lipoprotein NlpI
MGDFAHALADFNQAIRLKPQEPQIYDERGELRSVNNDDAGAMTDFNEAIQLDAKFAAAYNDRGNTYFDDGKIDKALADYGSAIKWEPDYANPYSNRGRIELFHTNRPADAATDLATAIRLDPGDIYSVLWLHIARTRSGTPDHDELAANAAKLSTAKDAQSWPRPLIDIFLGQATPEAARQAAGDADQKCEANFYIGLFDLEKNARDDAKKLIGTAASTCPADMLEKAAATAELARL